MNKDKKEVAQEVVTQEQFIGKCSNCDENNEVKVPNGIKPKFCMQCGKKIIYSLSKKPKFLNVDSVPQ